MSDGTKPYEAFRTDVERIAGELRAALTELEEALPGEPGDPGEPVPSGPLILRPQEWPTNNLWTSMGDHIVMNAVRESGQLVVASLEVPAGTYRLHARAFAPDRDSDAFYVGFDGAAKRVWPPQPGEWLTFPVGEEVMLEAGEHFIGLGPAESGLILDALVLIPTGFDGDLEGLLGTPPVVDEDVEPEPGDGDEEEPEPEPDPSGFSDATHRVAPIVDASFDPDRPLLRDGTALSERERQYHESFISAFLNRDASQYTAVVYNLGRPDSYHLGRHGEVIQESALQVMSRTGDGRILDELTVGWNLAFENLVIEWDPATTLLKGDKRSYVENNAGARIVDGKWRLSGDRTPWSPHRKWLYRGAGGIGGDGTDLNNLQTIKPWAILVRYLWALEVNRDAESPAGFDYGAEADKWRPVLRGFIDAYTSDTGADWEDNYRGLDGGLWFGSTRRRAKPGEWPFFVRGEGHAMYNSALLCFYCGLLGERGWDVPNYERAVPAADEIVRWIRGSLVDTVNSEGLPAILLPGGGGKTIMKATYTAYPAWEIQHLRDIGRWEDQFDASVRLRISRSYEDMIRPDGSTFGDLAAGVDRTGHGYRVGHGSPRTPFQNAVNGFSVPMIWSDNDYLFDTGTAAQTSNSWGGYGSGNRVHIIPAAQLLDLLDV